MVFHAFCLLNPTVLNLTIDIDYIVPLKEAWLGETSFTGISGNERFLAERSAQRNDIEYSANTACS